MGRKYAREMLSVFVRGSGFEARRAVLSYLFSSCVVWLVTACNSGVEVCRPVRGVGRENSERDA